MKLGLDKGSIIGESLPPPPVLLALDWIIVFEAQARIIISWISTFSECTMNGRWEFWTGFYKLNRHHGAPIHFRIYLESFQKFVSGLMYNERFVDWVSVEA